MNIIIRKNQDQVAEEASRIICTAWQRKPNLVLGLATGRTPSGLYRRLVELYRRGEMDFSRIVVFSLDEFWGLDRNHPLSFAHYLEEHLFSQVNLPENNIFLLDGRAENIEEHCRFYEEAIRRWGGIDIQILGIGLNGHIGFNEPGSSFGSRTHFQPLCPETIAATTGFRETGEEPPRASLTMGLATILEAKNILLLATGREKADIISQALEGPITASVPASCLQFHPSVFIILDEEAGSTLARKDFYLQAEAIKPKILRL